MSYIVKNCPAYEYNEEWDHHICKRNLAIYETTCDTCPECSDCATKQIIEKCSQKFYDNAFDKGKLVMANEILQLLDIQEVE